MRRKVLLVAILVFAMLLQCIVPFTVVHAANAGVGITLNKNLYNAVKNDLTRQGIVAQYVDPTSRGASGMIVIDPNELAKVKSLDLSNSNISSVEGLSAFSSLTTVNLTANELTGAEDNHLEELDSLNLKTLNLSTNQIESVNSISSFKEIEETDITSQVITKKEVVSVDISEESEHVKRVTINLPDIILMDKNNDYKIDWSWLDYELEGVDEDGDGILDYPTPYINYWAASDTSTELELVIASGNSDFKANKGLITITVEVPQNSTSKLAGATMKFYYVVVDSDETGIIFEDENMYKAVRDQLTAGQETNDELVSHPDNGNETIYKRKYDVPLILVIDSDDVINKVPSLLLNDKRIEDLTGLQEFVGLETNIDVSYNYIDTIERIIELDANKDEKEAELATKYQAALDKLSEFRSKVVGFESQLEAINKQINDKQNAYNTESAKATPDANVLNSLSTEISNLRSQAANIEVSLSYAREALSLSLEKCYRIYSKEFKLTAITPFEVNMLTKDDFEDKTLEDLKGITSSIISRLSSLEQNNGLTSEEIDLITSTYNIPTTQTITNADGTTEDKPIENPITQWMNNRIEIMNLSLTNQYSLYYDFINELKYLDIAIQAYNYSLIEAMNGYSGSIDDGLIMLYYEMEARDLDASYIEDVINLRLGETDTLPRYLYDGTDYTLLGENILNLSDVAPLTSADYNLEKIISAKLIASSGEVPNYVTLPRIQRLDLEDNELESIEGLDNLEELKDLNLYKNLIDDISVINWEGFVNLKNLNLGYNEISDIKPLEVLENLENLNVERNLLSGKFDFYLVNMKYLKTANFNYNQYYDLTNLKNQYILPAKNVRGADGLSLNLTVEEYLRRDDTPTITFQYQTMEFSTTIVKTDSFAIVDFNAYKIFAQAEDLDHERTSFGTESLYGEVLAKGKQVKLYTPAEGSYKAVVMIIGNNGYGDPYGPYTTDGMCFGTTCTIRYYVVANTVTPVTPDNPDPTNPDNPDPTNPDDPDNPTEPVDPESIELGYNHTPVENGMTTVFVFSPKTDLTNFAQNLVDLQKYSVQIPNNNTPYIYTGAVVTIKDKATNQDVIYAEIVVKGDVNGDGNVTSNDSGIISSVINAARQLEGVYSEAADVNNDGNINSNDKLLVLKYIADQIQAFED